MNKKKAGIISADWKKGSFTVETACVMSLILFTVMGILSLSFFVHNRAWLTSAAYEAALAGSMEGRREGGSAEATAAGRCKELGNMGFFGMENLNFQINSGKKIQVVYTADTFSGFGDFKWKLKAEGRSKILDPVTWLWNIKAAEDILTDTGGEE